MNKHIFITKQDVERVVATEPEQGKRMLPWQLLEDKKLPFNVLEDTVVVNEPEVHETEGDYWECLQGEVIFTVGGRLLNPRLTKEHEWKGYSIEGGEEIKMKPGDRLWIPPGVPHSHKKLDGTAHLMITKIR